MKSNIFIPQKIKIGFQSRSDTYTKKLAYIIYFDEKGILRKEKSWNSWRDKDIEPIEFDNVPFEGFVLNKKVGDYSTGWNYRQSYCRVYDSRDFEFEITIENLLYILENANSIKGKGLEGQFIYGWDGKDLILIPIESPDYKEIKEYNEIVHANNCIKTKDLKIGATYMTKNNEQWIYMGRFDYWKTESERIKKNTSISSWYDNYEYVYHDVNKGKYHFFMRERIYSWSDKADLELLTLKSLGNKFIDTISLECVENYAELFDKLERLTEYSPLDKSKDEYILYTLDEFKNKFNDKDYCYCYNSNKNEIYIDKYRGNSNQYRIENRSNWTGINEEGTIEEIYNKLQPYYRRQYLKNGKLYKEE